MTAPSVSGTAQDALEVRGLSVRYGQITALHGVDIRVPAAGLVAVVGANGAGKTTLLMTVSGIRRPAAGSVYSFGTRIDTLAAHRIARRGILHVPEGRHVFPNLSVEDNLITGWQLRPGASRGEALERIWQLFPDLRKSAGKRAGLLSGGQQQMLAIGRALIARPAVLLLDEPSLGLAPVVVGQVYELIRQLATEMPILLVEQNVRAALASAQHAYLLQGGEVVMSGPADEVAESPQLQQTLLGQGVA